MPAEIQVQLSRIARRLSRPCPSDSVAGPCQNRRARSGEAGEKPGGLRRRASGSRSERNVIVVDELAVVVLGLLRAAQEIDRLGDDLAAVTIDPGGVGPFRVVDAAANQNLHALVAMLLDRLAEAVEAGDAVPFGVLDPIAVLVAQDAAFRIAGARGGQGEVGDAGAALGGAGFGGLADVAGEDDDVLHCRSPLLLGGTVPPTRPGQGRRKTPATAALAAACPQGPRWGGQPRLRGNTAGSRGGCWWKPNGLRGSVRRRDGAFESRSGTHSRTIVLAGDSGQAGPLRTETTGMALVQPSLPVNVVSAAGRPCHPRCDRTGYRVLMPAMTPSCFIGQRLGPTAS
ncbi:hypothetical protein SDC9_25515 [bioreactor metagenome]|uniref:Uncharacterized protein n=1 Tax=bioreactor metagenome TaxID=1076179 RepID=A0A644UL59_9ZZZZ